MSDNPHLIIAYAATNDASCQQALPQLALPQLQKLLKQRTPAPADRGELEDFAPPHERALARALGLPTQATPWAALQRLQQGEAPGEQAWAFITPCHWHISPDQVRMSELAAAQMSDAESRQLLEIMAPWFAEDGITLVYERPDRWLAQGEVFRGLQTAALDRIALRDVRPWLPNKEQAAVLQRLQTEMQMLLYTHSWSDAREAQGQAPINSFWVHGAGALPQGYQLPAQQPLLNTDLRDAALQGNWPAWQQQWQKLDARLAGAAPGTLTLCGEKNAISLQLQPQGLLQKIKQLLASPQVADLLKSL